MSTLFLAGQVVDSIVDGPGLRHVLFVQGCPHHCTGCHNPQTHAFTGGQAWQIGDLADAILQNPMLSGVTFSGGEPFCQARPLALLAQTLKARGLHLIAYSGYTLEEILQLGEEARALLALCDWLIDGKFIEEQQSQQLAFRGSRNQRILDVPQSLEQGRAVWVQGYCPEH